MNLTYEIIKDELSDQLDCQLYGAKVRDQKYISCTIYEKGMAVNDNYVYICRGIPYELTDTPVRSLFIICNEVLNPVSAKLMKKLNHIAFSEEVSFIQIANQIINIFTKLNYWYEHLEIEISKPGFLDNLLSLSFPLLENTIVITDADLRPISKYDSTLGIVDTHLLDSSDQFMVRVRDAYIKTRNYKKVLKSHLEGDYQRLIYNLFDANKLVGIISLQADSRPLRPSDADILKELGDFIALLFQHLGSKYLPHVNQLCKTISQLINTQNITQVQCDAIDHLAELSGIEKDEELQVMVINESANKADRYIAYFMHSLSTKVPGLVIDSEENGTLAFIIRRSFAQANKIDVDKILMDYLKGYNFYAAVSDPYQDLTTTRAYYIQAFEALKISVTDGNTEHLTSFSKCYLDYLINRVTSDIAPQNLYSVSFRKILAIDGDSKISYLETLRAYMVNHLSATKTANALYISRNALMYRLDKILAIIRASGEDLSDKDDFLRIQLSFFLYDHFEPKS